MSPSSTSAPNRVRFLLAVIALAMLAAACSGASDGAPIASSSTSSEPDEPTPATDDQTGDEIEDDAAADPSPTTSTVVDDAILAAAQPGTLVVDGTEYVLDAVEPLFDEADGGPALIGIFADEQGVVFVPVDLATQEPLDEVIVVLPDGRELSGTIVWQSALNDGFSGTGELADDGAPLAFDLTLRFGVGTSAIEIDGNRAIVTGDLGSATYAQVQHLIEFHPDVDTLVLADIGGSVNDEVNVETGRLVRSAGYTTLVPSDGQIYSGGVDLFVAGVKRIAEPGATLGVHAWCCGPEGESAHLLPQDDPAHDLQIAYFTEMLGDEAGRAMYFFTLQAAPFDGIDPMTPAELDYFGAITSDGVLGEPVDRTELAVAGFDATSATATEAAEAILAGAGSPTPVPVLTLDGDPARIVAIAEPTETGAGRVIEIRFQLDGGRPVGVVSATEWAVPPTTDSGESASAESPTEPGGSGGFAVGPVPDALAPLQASFAKYVEVFGVHIVGTAATDDADLLHAANVMAQYLDNDADGSPDVPAVVEAMVANRATLLMAATPDEFENLGGAELDAIFDFVGRGGQDLYGSETNPSGGFDASLEEVHHLILNTGWSVVYPDELSIDMTSELASALDVARGGRFESIPASYPEGAWFTYDDATCDYDCMLVEYFYWAHTSLLGAQEDRADEIGHEWRLETPAEVRSGDAAVVAIIDSLPLPTILPDGQYTG